MARAITRDLGKERATTVEASRAPNIVGKIIKVKFDDEGLLKTSDLSTYRGEKGTLYDGQAKKLDQKSQKHQVYFPYDKKNSMDKFQYKGCTRIYCTSVLEIDLSLHGERVSNAFNLLFIRSGLLK